MKLDVSDYNLEGLSVVHLKDAYCSNPDCSCGGTILCATRLVGSKLGDWIQPAQEIQFIVNAQTGEIVPKGPASPLRQALQKCLERRLDGRQLKRLLKRRQEVLRQNCEDGWRYRDWSDFEPGTMMSWADIFPETPAPSIRTPHGRYFLDDYYCCTFGCTCTEVQLAIVSTGTASEVCGTVLFDHRSGLVTAQPQPGFPHKVLFEILNSFFEQHPTLRAELRRRGEFMTGPVARYVHESVTPCPSRTRSSKVSSRVVAPPPEVVANVAVKPLARVGRNESCPCGSGRKYKKCCLAS